MSEITLHVDAQYASPYAMSAFVALTVKQVPFELRTVDLRPPRISRRRSPTCR